MIKPILFNEQMVRAILEDRKTETRRIVKDNTLFGLLKDPETRIMRMSDEDDFYPAGAHFRNNGKYYLMKPAYKAGDILWVRETWQFVTDMDANEDFMRGTERYMYAASDTPTFNTWINADGSTSDHMPWRPSIHMPKSAARIFLKVKNVRAERLQEMTVEDIEREGLYCDAPYTKDHYAYAPGMMLHWQRLWNSTVKPTDLDRYGWDANPWVWVYEFERCEKPEEWEV